MYASQWFITAFAYNYPSRLVARIWDAFFARGWTAVFQIALAMVEAEDEALLESDFEGILCRMKGAPNCGQNTEAIVRKAIAIPVAPTDLSHSLAAR